jgi:hypothetical protein
MHGILWVIWFLLTAKKKIPVRGEILNITPIFLGDFSAIFANQ